MFYEGEGDQYQAFRERCKRCEWHAGRTPGNPSTDCPILQGVDSRAAGQVRVPGRRTMTRKELDQVLTQDGCAEKYSCLAFCPVDPQEDAPQKQLGWWGRWRLRRLLRRVLRRRCESADRSAFGRKMQGMV